MPQTGIYQNYSQNRIQTANKKQLVVMLYEGMNKFLKQALLAFDAKDIEGVHTGIQKTNKVLLELLSTLDESKGREIAINLKNIYIYSYETLVVANLQKDRRKIEEVAKIIEDLTQAWKQSLKKQNQSQQSEQTQAKKVSIIG